MNRTAIFGLAICAVLLASGKPQPAAQSGDAARAKKSSAESIRSTEFGAGDVARFLERANPALSTNDVRRTSVAIVRNSRKYGLDPILVTQVLWVESGARPWVRSPLGAIGLMQVMPHMAEPMGLAGSFRWLPWWRWQRPLCLSSYSCRCWPWFGGRLYLAKRYCW